ncbi:MAG TPA: hypothetical protein VFS08_02465 [Gemmatimonadaceae bacterium]|nr:hypothetical protein [Gemmatimonadaceae bacterium]
MPAMRPRSPLRPRLATIPSPAASWRAVAAIGLAAIAAACGPRVEPRTTPVPPARPAPPPEPVIPETAPTFRYAAGESAYLLETRAVIEVAGDTTAGQDTLTRTLRVRYELDGDGLARQLTGVIDSLAVTSGGRVPAPADSARLPVRFEGVLQDGRVTLAPIPVLPPPTPMAPTPTEPVPPGECSPEATLVGAARALFPSFPLPLGEGARWSDTVVTTTCRAGVRLTTTTVHHYTVDGATTYAGRPSRRVDVVSDITVSGEGRQGREHVTTSGSGTERGVLHVDPAAGRILYGTSETTLDLTFRAGSLVQRVTQRSREDIRLATP